MALVTFDDFEWASAISPALTAAAQPFHAVGAQAVQLLQRRLADPFAPRRVVRLPGGDRAPRELRLPRRRQHRDGSTAHAPPDPFAVRRRAPRGSAAAWPAGTRSGRVSSSRSPSPRACRRPA